MSRNIEVEYILINVGRLFLCMNIFSSIFCLDECMKELRDFIEV